MILKENKPEEYRCARCKASVEAADPRWRMGCDGWEHACADRDPNGGHNASERVPLRDCARLLADGALAVCGFAAGVLSVLALFSVIAD